MLGLAECNRWRYDLVVLRHRSARSADAYHRLVDWHRWLGIIRAGIGWVRDGWSSKARHWRNGWGNAGAEHDVRSGFIFIRGRRRRTWPGDDLFFRPADDGRLVERRKHRWRMLIFGRTHVNRAQTAARAFS